MLIKLSIPVMAVIFALLIPLMCFLVVLNADFYFESKVKDYSPSSKSMATNIYKFIQDEEELNNDGLTFREIEHLTDVQSLIIKIKGFTVFLVVISLMLFYLLSKKLNSIKSALHLTNESITLASIFLVFFGLFALMLSFTSLFSTFHKLFFLDDSYMFPENSVLIQLFPEQFFMYYFKNIAFLAFFVIIVFLVGKLVKKYFFRKSKNVKNEKFIN